MSVIWTLERPQAAGPVVATALIGDFAVRAFASLDSFAMLLRLGNLQPPDALLVDAAATSLFEPTRLTALIKAHLPNTPVVRVQGAGILSGDELPTPFVITRPIDGLNLSAFVRYVIRAAGSGRRAGAVRYGDVMLDTQKLQCQVLPTGELVPLTLKEAQLLKLFLERPGVCLSRGAIAAAIWDEVRVSPRTIDSHISRLRKHLQEAEVEIQSIYGDGYILR